MIVVYCGAHIPFILIKKNCECEFKEEIDTDLQDEPGTSSCRDRLYAERIVYLRDFSLENSLFRYFPVVIPSIT